MGKLKFGDKVQLVSINAETYRVNVLNGREPLRYNSYVNVGDVGVVVRESSLYDRPRVLFQTNNGGTETIIVDEKDILPESDESQVVFLNNVLKIQDTVKVSSKKYSTLDNNVIFDTTKVKVGCQNISKEDALQIAADITAHFGK